MAHGPRQAIARRLPENVVYTLVLARHGETAAQLAIRRAAADWVHRTGRSGDDPGRRPSPKTVYTFDAHETQRETVRAVSAALERVGVGHVLVPELLPGRCRIAVATEDRAAALTAVARGLVAPEWAAEAVGGRRRPHSRVAAPDAGELAGCRSVRIFRLLSADNGEPIAGADLACELDFWSAVDASSGGGEHPVGTRLAPRSRGLMVDHLSASSWDIAVSAPGHWPPDAVRGTLFQVREPIDIVYTWVDGDDPQWLARKDPYDSTVLADELNHSAIHQSRFSSRDELRYSLRSVAMYANWVRKIFIVTDGQAPAWLDTDHPKIELVDHTQIFSDVSVLPVFNSHAIESQLHHIPGLSERYLYLNDDVFFGRPVWPELFFHGNGVAKFFLSETPLDIDAPSSQELPVVSAAKRNRALIEARFAATVVHKFQHTPHPQVRSVHEQLEREYPEVFASVAASRFRHPTDLSIASALHHYFAYGLGRAVPDRLRYVYQDTAREDTRRRLRNLLRTRDADAICLNELEVDPSRAAEQREMLAGFFERYFPVPSPFELVGARDATLHGGGLDSR